MKTLIRFLGVASVGIVFALTAWAQSPDPVVSAEPTVFREVTAKLDAGGSLYAYLSTSQWTAGLASKVREIREAVLGLADLSGRDRAQAEQVFTLIENVVRRSGLESVAGVGMSGIALEPGFYRTRTVVQRSAGSGDGYLWQFFGRNPHALAGLDWLPADTVYAVFIDVDLAGIWSALKTEAESAQLAPVVEALSGVSAQVQEATGRSLEEQLSSMGGEVGVAIVLDSARQFSLPLPGGPIELPEPALLIALKVKDDALFDWADRLIADNPQSTRGESGGARWRSIAVPGDLPFPVRPTVGRAEDYLWLASNDQVLEKAVKAHAGDVPGLRQTAEFKRLARGLPEQGNSFAFVGQRFSNTLWKLQEAFLEQAAGGGEMAPLAGLFRRFLGFGTAPAAFSVGRCDAEGMQSVSQGTQEPATVLVSSVLVAPTAMMAGMLLPALAKAKAKAQEVACMNNLKQIGLALRIYANDHDDTLPPDFASMQNELSTPRVLFCPLDPGFADAGNLTWSNFDFSRSSYEYLKPGIKDSEASPDTPVVRCRIHGSVVHLDGSVRGAPR